MAMRCKGSATDILNFDIAEYQSLVPLLERLSKASKKPFLSFFLIWGYKLTNSIFSILQEDIVTALRNYSKSQTALRTGIYPGTPSTQKNTLRVRSGGVQKSAATRRAAAATATAAAAASRRPGTTTTTDHLSISIPRRRRRPFNDFYLPDEDDEEEEEEEEQDYDAMDADYIATLPLGTARYVQTRIPTRAQHRASTHHNQLQQQQQQQRSGRCPGSLGVDYATPVGSESGSPVDSATIDMLLQQSFFNWSPPVSPHTPHAVHAGPVKVGTPPDVSEFDSVDFDKMLNHLVDESVR